MLLSTSPYTTDIPVEILLRSKLAGAQVFDTADFYENHFRKVLLEKLEAIQLLFCDNLCMTRMRWFLKDSLEKLVAILLLVVTSPLMLLAAATIKLTSSGPVFYVQERVGQDGKIFKLIKFRTMKVDAEKDGPVWAKKDDPRVTFVGRVLRKARIDELPQVFNLLAGQMAFVGPRPERPEFVSELRQEIPFYDQRHLVKPGITGWAQVSYPYGASVEDAREKLRYDLYYVKNMSLFFDTVILLATVRTVLFKAYGR